MTDVNTKKFYQFLAQYEASGQSWANKADAEYGNGDGTVIKAEFRQFMNAEWNGEETLTNDLINQFWKSIDTDVSAKKIAGTKYKNLNALDTKELDALDKKLEVYVKFDQFIAENVKVPNVIVTKGQQWKNDVVTQLSAYIDKCTLENLESTLASVLPAISNHCTAEYCALEYQESLASTILKEYPQYQVTDDTVLQNLISTYIKTVGADTEPMEIKDNIKSIMDAYFATAELGVGSDYDLSELGYDNNTLNGIQRAVVTEKIKADVKSVLGDAYKDYEDYEDDFNAAVDKFITSKLASGDSFEELKDCATEFITSDYKMQLDDIIFVKSNFSDIKIDEESGSFYQKLVSKFGEEIAKEIVINDRFTQAYNDLISELVEKISTGKINRADVEDYIIQRISANLSEFLVDGFPKVEDLSRLGELYDNLVKASDEQKDNDLALKQRRQAAIMYCDALCAQNNKGLTQAVYDQFGSSDYASVINSKSPAYIDRAIQELKSKVEVANTTITWNDFNGKFDSIGVNESKSMIISASANNGKPLTYGVTATGAGSATIDSNTGKITVTGGSSAGTITITVQAYIDGIAVGEEQTLTVNVKNTIGETTKNNMIATQPTAVSLTDGYLSAKSQSVTDDIKSTATMNIINNIDNLVTQLSGAGYDKTRLENAAASLKLFYSKLIAAITDDDNGMHKGKNAEKTKVVIDGKTYTYTHEARDKEKRMSAKADTDTGITLRENTGTNHGYNIMINMQVVAQKLIDLYNA